MTASEIRVAVTYHALDRWRGRCGQPAQGNEQDRRAIETSVENGRMPTPEETAAIGLWLGRGRSPFGLHAKALAPEQVVIDDDLGVAFLLDLYDADRPCVITCLFVDRAIEYFHKRKRPCPSRVRRVEE